MKGWRPPDWKIEEIVEDALMPLGKPDKDKVKRALFRLVEAGADAILKAIIRQLQQDKQEIKKQKIGEWQQGQLHEIDSLLSRLGEYDTD